MIAKAVNVGSCLLIGVALLTAGCTAEEMNADTACRDFLQAPIDEQNAAVARVADNLGADDAMTPLGRPNIDYICSQDQDRTLGEAVEATG